MANIDILQIAREAEKKRLKDPRVINATIGMFYDEQRKIGGIPVVVDRIHEMPDVDMLPYPSVDGGDTFKKNLISWVFGEYEDVIRHHFHIAACATPGGSGAIASTFSVYSNPGDYVFVSNVRWQYDRFGNRAKLKMFEHNTFKNGHFDVSSFKKRLEALCKIQKRVIVIVNDPCHNPTGYTLSIDEWNEIIASLNAFTNNDIVFLYDLAYLEFSHEKNARFKISKLTDLLDHVFVVIAFSGSKTFGVYGLRMGAAIGLSKRKTAIESFYKKFVNEARGSWSATPTISISLLNYFAQKQQKENFLKVLETTKSVVAKRSAIFKKEAQESGLETYPFSSGFYTIVKTPDPMKSFEKLSENDIYVIPMAGGIRIALCSITIAEVTGLAARIKQIINM